jgi:epoxyqueuosine reductase
VASYAWGDDYHDVLVPRMRALVAFIETTTGETVPNRYYTDTGPVMERDLGERAGLGWIGKNTCLIHPQKGSYFLLAEILLGIDLVPDQAFAADHCGTCTRCLEACPTNCILPDRTIDARRCISYLTIELKSTIPHELRPQMGDWVFGCDICQQVCPWNLRFARQPGDPDIATRPELARPDLVESIKLTPEAFNARFKGTPVKRTKRRGYLRNIAVAMGNLDDSEAIQRAVPALASAVREDGEPLVRGHAAWALGQLGGETAQHALESALQSEDNNDVLEEIKLALEAIR